MKILNFSVEDFRNISKLRFIPHEGVNIIYGQNAQGKTNLLEAIWLFTGNRSFRTYRDAEMIKFGSARASLKMDFFSEEREQNADITITPEKKSAKLNEIPLKSVSYLTGALRESVFSPIHLSLAKNGPSERRNFIDFSLSQIRPKYAGILSDFKRNITQRNALLKELYNDEKNIDSLDIWDNNLAVLAGKIIRQRIKYIEKLEELAKPIYQGITKGRENISLRYDNSANLEGDDPEQLAEQYILELSKNRHEDIKKGVTSLGPHRDDLIIETDGLNIRSFGSQGQQRSAVLALKLAEASLLYNMTGEKPIILLDDVMSELDLERQDYILNHIFEWQVFITCCERDALKKLAVGAAFEIKNGELIN